MTSYYFSIIGTRDNPIYEVEFSSFKNVTSLSGGAIPGKSQFSSSIKEILPFIANSSLDIIEDAQWSTSQYYLGKIDSFYGLLVNAFTTQGNIKLVLCYDVNNNAGQKNDDNSIKQFFVEVNDLYVKCLLNPFYSVNDAITSPDFDLRVKMAAKKYF